jgi:hypothetical protein
MDHLNESSVNDLFASAVRAFPYTRMRQHATGPIIIESLRWTPFLGVKTLFIKAEARNEDRHYTPMILFKNVDYDGDGITIIASDGLEYSFDKLSLENQDVLLRCNCPDFYWRFNYYDYIDRSLYGNKRGKYESKGGLPANPKKLPGMCKHLMKMSEALRDAGLFYD